jgi:hypothetical protein
MKEVQEKLLPGELGVSPRISLPPRVGDQRGLNTILSTLADESMP